MIQTNAPEGLPPVLAGPVLRRLEPGRLVLWLAASAPLDLTLVLAPRAGAPRRLALDARQCRVVRVGRHACVHLIDVALPEPLPHDTIIEYDLLVTQGDGKEAGIAHWAPHLLHLGATRPNMVLRSRSDNILYGSCRKPHHPSPDGLARADALLADHAQLANARADERPAMLMLCGDQVYADDVAGPMLAAIHALIRRLGLYAECLDGAVVADSEALYSHPASYYRREELLPAFRSNDALRDRFFGGSEKPIFTTANAHNHLVTLAEVMAMYLLVWSPVPWQLVTDAPAPALEPRHAERWRRESQALEGFCRELPQAARLLAHVQTLMIFDDHDITDDWNLSAKWESTVYEHPFSRRIVGNALIAYMLCQAWGNCPDVFETALDDMAALAATAALDDRLDAPLQDALVRRLFSFRQWGFVIRSTPTIIVLDTRTRRWRNRHWPGHPSGLMDWESLTELQHELLDETAAVIVSPAPMFGVKLIEVVQRVATFAGLALTVDAENWMAHRGAASCMLNIFRHSRTPGNYVVLSGDVHYSFAYDISLRELREARDPDRTPHIWQITSSGIKNEFPRRLLDWLDRLNRWLYSPRSPLNWFTQRRDLALTPRLPDSRQRGERVWNGAGIGQVWLDAQGRPVRIMQHNADGRPSTRFLAPEQEASLAPVTEQPFRKH